MTPEQRIARSVQQHSDLSKLPVMKLVLIGDAGVGKTTLLERLEGHPFMQDMNLATIGVDFKVRTVEYKSPNGEKVRVKFQLWDTAGQERFADIVQSYFRNATGIILVFDISDERQESLSSLVNTWMKRVRVSSDAKHFLLIGNKLDIVLAHGGKKEECLAENSLLKQLLESEGTWKYHATSAAFEHQEMENIFDGYMRSLIKYYWNLDKT